METGTKIVDQEGGGDNSGTPWGQANSLERGKSYTGQ